jgi:hypothetical protein
MITHFETQAHRRRYLLLPCSWNPRIGLLLDLLEDLAQLFVTLPIILLAFCATIEHSQAWARFQLDSFAVLELAVLAISLR